MHSERVRSLSRSRLTFITSNQYCKDQHLDVIMYLYEMRDSGMGRRPKPETDRRRNRLMIYLTDQEQDRLQYLCDQMELDKTELVYEGLHAVFEATRRRPNQSTEVDDMQYPEYQDNSSQLDGQQEPYGRKPGEWLPGDPCKVRFFAAEYANQRGIVQAVESDHCLVQLRGQDELVRITTTNLIYWDDEDESWVMAPASYHDDEDLNSDDHP